MTDMLDLTWAHARSHHGDPLLDTLLNADLIAATGDEDAYGHLHFAHCPEAPEGMRVRVEVPWSALVPLVRTTPLSSCWCADPTNSNLPASIRAVSFAPALEDARSQAFKAPDVTDVHGARGNLLRRLAEMCAPITLARGYRFAESQPILDALLELAREVRASLGFVDGEPESTTRGLDPMDYAQMVATYPTGVLATPDSASEYTSWAEEVFANSSWVDAAYLSGLNARYVNRYWIPSDVSRVLVRVPDQILAATTAGRHVISHDPHLDPSTLPPALTPR